MKIAIHHHPGSFSDSWITYCKKKNIPYKVINAFDNNILQELQDCNIFMWHHHHGNIKEIIAAKKILFALEHAGIKVFPNFKTGWHFDDKVAQKYLLEAISAPLVPSYVFYEKNNAINWAKKTSYPKVFKLKGGAGATNVRLIKNQKEAFKIIKKSFGKGFPQFNRLNHLKEKINNFKSGKDNFSGILKGIARLFIKTELARQQANEKGYVYFQDFMPDNTYDTRVVVIAGKYAAAEKRFVRKGDFRASGSGLYSYDDISEDIIKTAFQITQKLNLQSVAFDFIKNSKGENLIVEMSYGFGTDGITQVSGYWDKDLNWHKAAFTPQIWMIDQLTDNLFNELR